MAALNRKMELLKLEPELHNVFSNLDADITALLLEQLQQKNETP